jgi:hypothetical protein
MDSRSDHKAGLRFKIVSLSEDVSFVKGLLILAVRFDTAEGKVAHWKSLDNLFFCW